MTDKEKIDYAYCQALKSERRQLREDLQWLYGPSATFRLTPAMSDRRVRQIEWHRKRIAEIDQALEAVNGKSG